MVKHLRTYNLLAKTLVILAIALGSVSFAPAGISDVGPYAETRTNVTRYYPNPATSFINFEFSKNINKSHTLQIYSFTGRKMYESAVNSERLTVKLEEFFRGVYFFQLRDRTGKIIETGKFQVVR